MKSLSSSSHSVSLHTRSLPKKSQTPIGQSPPSLSPLTPSTSATSNIPKPMRPLTAYHIFFQIEREYIIQNTAGPDADASIHDNKSCIPGAPRRYRCTKLLPDWYAGPGKRQKRKHRKSHGKIGFLELSRVISKRWATLDAVDPETKQFVARIAAKELAQYKVEMNEYNEMMKSSTVANAAPKIPIPQPVASAAATATVGTMISPGYSPMFGPEKVSSSHDVPPMPTQYFQPLHSMPDLSLGRDFASSESYDNEDEIDYSICRVSNNGHYIPSPGPFHFNGSNMIHHDGSICDPLFELEDGHSSYDQPVVGRCVSPASVDSNVDVIDDVDFVPFL